MALVADEDPRFQALHPDVRALLRDAEQLLVRDLRTGLDSVYPQLSPVMLDALKPVLEAFTARIPAQFIRAMYELFKMLSDDTAVAEQMVTAHLKGIRPVSDKPQ
jgi:hypothetical protein